MRIVPYFLPGLTQERVSRCTSKMHMVPLSCGVRDYTRGRTVVVVWCLEIGPLPNNKEQTLIINMVRGEALPADVIPSNFLGTVHLTGLDISPMTGHIFWRQEPATESKEKEL